MSQPSDKVKIIDLFAGPGGLGEGFSNCDNSPFEIAMSVEKEKNAHKTLTLRSFYRKLKDKSLYVRYVTCTDESSKRLIMDEIEKTDEWRAACEETLQRPHALGNSKVFEKWKNGEVPDEKDFEEETPEQQEINRKIDEVCRSTGEDRRSNLRSCSPLIVIGGPPCQAYSTIGRARRVGIANHNQDHDERFFLYKEYADVIDRARPNLFVMENVSGIGSAKLANGVRVFPEIIKRLEYLKENPDPEKDQKQYHIYSLVTDKDNFIGSEGNPSDKDFVINAADFGVPQERRRVILLGINAEHDKDGSLPLTMDSKLAPLAPSISETIASLPKIRSSISTANRSSGSDQITEDSPSDSDLEWQKIRNQCLDEIREIVSGEDAIERGIRDIMEWERRSLRFEKARQVKATRDISEHDLVRIFLSSEEEHFIECREGEYRHILSTIYPKIAQLLDELEIGDQLSTGCNFYLKSQSTKALTSNNEDYGKLENWLANKYFSGVLNHRAKQHMPSDMTRYMFSALWTEAQMLVDAEHSSHASKRQTSTSPTTKFFPANLASQHKSWYSRNFQDRFRCYPRLHRAKTITSHMHKDGHANIHYDPTQMRSLTVREAARIQTFPDDYYFEGGQSAQYLQVGNAVPPFLAKQIAEHVLEVMKYKNII